MFTALEKVGLLCMCIIGFQILRFVLRTLYNNLIAPNLGLHVKVAEMGKWAGKLQKSILFKNFPFSYVYNRPLQKSKHMSNIVRKFVESMTFTTQLLRNGQIFQNIFPLLKKNRDFFYLFFP